MLSMKTQSWVLVFLIIFFGVLSSICNGYDMLDPNGNITIKWDLKHDDGETQYIFVSIYNYQLFRHIDHPGWKLSWTWQNKEVIWNMLGAEAAEQGDCTKYKGHTLPHCCSKTPVIVDLMPGAPYNVQTQNCCKGGVLSSFTQDPDKYWTHFEMSVGGGSGKKNEIVPVNFSLGLDGYTCGAPEQVAPSKFYEDNGRRKTQALATWNVTCSYSQFLASPTPKCCVSLSAFYSETVVRCPECSCGCQGQSGIECVKPGNSPPILKIPQDEEPRPLVQCTGHMCPVKLHWHVKENYKEYWRVKITITNLNFVRNYSQWSLVVQHPNLKSIEQIFSFYYKPLNQHGPFNDSGVFYGIKYYNDMLLQRDQSGNVQSEILLRKDKDFTFRGGWAFPRKISFNGDECVMSPPDEFPTLPNIAKSSTPSTFHIIVLSLLFILIL